MTASSTLHSCCSEHQVGAVDEAVQAWTNVSSAFCLKGGDLVSKISHWLIDQLAPSFEVEPKIFAEEIMNLNQINVKFNIFAKIHRILIKCCLFR